MKLLIRVDTSTQIGTGHVMRCIALAQACLDSGGEAIFLMAAQSPALETRLKSEGIKAIYLSLVDMGSAEDAKETASISHQLDVSWLIVDGYHFNAEYQKIIKDSRLRLLFIDDYGHADHYYANIVLNQNIYAHEGLYPNREHDTQLLLGLGYVLLRREFWQWRAWKRETPTVAQKVLVTLGGSDPDNVTFKVIQALQQLGEQVMEAVIVVGGSNPHYELLQSSIQGSPFAISIRRNVMNMPELMAWADVAIAASGSTTWELAFMNLPSILLALADHQMSIAEQLNTMGVFVNLGWHEEVSEQEIAKAIAQLLSATEKRREMTKKGRELVDGYGAARVVANLE